MQKEWAQWGIVFVAAVLVSIAAAKFAYFPGDVALARLVQSATGADVSWARAVTNTINPPWNVLFLAVIAALAWLLAGWRGAIVVLIGFGSLALAEPHIKGLIARPRPSPLLVRVTGSPTGFSFPSGFGMLYFSLFGTLMILAWQRMAGPTRTITIILCGLFLLVGGCARIALGAHWPSDILGAWLVGLAWILLLMRLAQFGRARATI